MKYLGSGQLSALIAEFADDNAPHSEVIVIGRRLRNMALRDFLAIRGLRVAFLDTVEGYVQGMSTANQVKWYLNPYRLEKSLTFLLIKLFAGRVVRLHIPAILDSPAWIAQRVDANTRALQISGLLYEHVPLLCARAMGKSRSRYRALDCLAEIFPSFGDAVPRLIVRYSLSADVVKSALHGRAPSA